MMGSDHLGWGCNFFPMSVCNKPILLQFSEVKVGKFRCLANNRLIIVQMTMMIIMTATVTVTRQHLNRVKSIKLCFRTFHDWVSSGRVGFSWVLSSGPDTATRPDPDDRTQPDPTGRDPIMERKVQLYSWNVMFRHYLATGDAT